MRIQETSNLTNFIVKENGSYKGLFSLTEKDDTQVYKISDIAIPQDKRQNINEKILHLIETDSAERQGISKQNIYDMYSGSGGLHGLNFKDFDSFYSYTEAKKLEECGEFFTPHKISKFLVDCLKIDQFQLVADLTAGSGNFVNWIPNHYNVYANELNIKNYKVMKHLYSTVNATCGDIREYNPGVTFDTVVGNPPFNLKLRVGREEYLSQFYYCLKAYELLKPLGILALIVPVSFLADDFTDGGMIKKIDTMYNFLYQVELPSDSFKSAGVDSFRTKIMFFSKKSEHVTDNKPYNTSMKMIQSISDTESEEIHTQYIAPIMKQREALQAKLYYEDVSSNDHSKEEKDFQFKVNKLLFDIKRNSKTSIYYAKCNELIHRLKNQVKPEGISVDEWMKVRLTPNILLAKLKKILKNQHVIECDDIRLVKNAYGLRLKGYSHKNKLYLSKFTGIKDMSFTDMIINDVYPFDDTKYKKVLSRKIKAYKRQSEPFKSMMQDGYISEWLNGFSLYNKNTEQIIKLKDFQKEDMQKVLQKDRSIIAWNVGLGKSEAGITWMKYVNEHNSTRNTFIVSSSISIKMTWTDRLGSYGISYKKIESLSDVYSIQPNEIVLVSFNMLVKYQKHIKKYIKLQGRKIAFILDESHRCIYPNTKTTKAVNSAFQKARYKLLMSGTPTKNTANELYSQFMILYGSSVNFMCECEKVLSEDKKTGEWKEEPNKYYLKPFPSYKQSVFSSCFSPKKTSVFGIEKGNQDILNSSKLIKLIEKTIIVRSMFEVMSKDVVEFKTHRIAQNENEKEVYKLIMEEFHSIVRAYYGTSGNYRRDAMLRIIQQIQLLQKAVSIPHKLKEYKGRIEPNKYKEIAQIIKNVPNDKVALGTTFIDSAVYYYNKLKTEFNDRSIFLILGETPFKKRQELIKEFEATENGLLISTQMSLSESVNIPSCDVVICEGLQYNIANMMQYIGRFTRLNSKNKTVIYFITYLNTLEQNILALLMSKQRINEFVKQCEYKEDAEIFNEFGISLDIFSSIITKSYDEDGTVKLSWGKQEIVK